MTEETSDLKCYRGGRARVDRSVAETPSAQTTTPVTNADRWLIRALDEQRLTVPLRPAFAYLDDKKRPRLTPDCRFVGHDVVLLSATQMQHAVVLAAGSAAMQVLGCITLDLIWCANGDVKQLAERPRKNSKGGARVERERGSEIEVDGATRWPNTVPSSCLVLHDATPSGFLRRLRRIEREPLRQALMNGTGPFGGWDDDADDAFDAIFDLFEATMPDEAAVAAALDHLERTKTTQRQTHRDLIVLPQRLMQANPAIASQVQAFLTAATTNDGVQLFGQDIAEALEPVPQKLRSKLTRKERHVADRQELLLQTDRADAAEARISELEQLLEQVQPVPDVPKGGDVTDDRSLTAPTQGRRQTR